MLRAADVTLAPVDEAALEQLVAAATADAAASEVTPPSWPENDWSDERVAWLEAFHRDRRGASPVVPGEHTWVVLVGTRVVGSVRLARIGESDVVETGIWLTRQARGHGIGQAAVAAVLQEAAALGAVAVRAETSVGNSAALAVLRHLGFTSVEAGDGRVAAQRAL